MKPQTEIFLRSWTKKDFAIVKNILLTTWKDTYSFISEKDILSHFKKFYSKDRLIEMINDPFTKGIISEINSVPAGWMKLFEDIINKRFYVSSLYVLPTFQGYGLGKRLLNESYSIAREKQLNKVWLGVMNQNEKALDWYRNLGFVFIEEEPFQMGSTQVTHLIGYKVI